jgi:O-phospho-L-seryl-tRNASec:L-selenocysteinyl-tRNA synthase
MNAGNLKLAMGLVDPNYIKQGGEALKSRENLVKKLLSQRSLPDVAWDDITIEHFLSELALMDSNNFKDSVGFGEREGRVYSNLVSQRHYRLGHGIGRSGDITAVQPKAAGSSLISQLTRALALSCIKVSGIQTAKAALVLPVATGMSIALTLMTLRAERRAEPPQNARYVLWLRIDQKACFKAIYTAGLVPVVIGTVVDGDIVRADLNELRAKILELGRDNILCVLSTTSCFAPRARDDVETIATICKEANIGHVINNAYGLIDSKCCHAVNQACRVGRVDAFVQSTDKNLMVPVGGAIVAGPNKKFITRIGENYPGRASMSPILDLFITLISLGKDGWKQKLKERARNVPVLVESLRQVAEKYGERVLETSKGNNISIAVTCDGVEDPTELGSWLFKRSVSGTRVVAPGATKTTVNTSFVNWGASHVSYPSAYITFAASMGQRTEEIPILCAKLDAAFNFFAKKKKKKEQMKLSSGETKDGKMEN